VIFHGIDYFMIRDTTRTGKMDKTDYSASFTAGALLLDEFQGIKSLLTAPDFFDLLSIDQKENKYLKIRTETARTRIISEIKKRYEAVPKDFWTFATTLEDKEYKLALFYTCLKAYTLVLEFHVEVGLKKWDLGFKEIDNYDLQMRLDEIASTDDVVYGWSETTRKRVIRGYKTMLKQAGLMKKNDLVKPMNISFEFWDYFISQKEIWFIEACFYNRNEV